MRVVGSFDPSSAMSGTIEVGAADTGAKVLLKNLSLINIKLDFQNGKSDLLSAGETNYWLLDAYTPEISWSRFSMVSAAPPPISECGVVVYDPDESIAGTYPSTLIHQITVGNNVPVGTAASSIANDGNPAGTRFVEGSVQGQAASSFILTNDGLLQLAVLIAGTLVQAIKTNNSGSLLQLGSAGQTAEVLGSLQVDQASTLSTLNVLGNLNIGGLTIKQMVASLLTNNVKLQLGVQTDGDVLVANPGGQTYLKGATGVALQDPNGSTVFQTFSSGAQLSQPLYFGNTGKITAINGFSGGGTQTITHGLGATPTHILATPNSNATVWISNVTSTQFTVNATGTGWWVLALIM